MSRLCRPKASAWAQPGFARYDCGWKGFKGRSGFFLGALGDLDPEAPGTTEAEAKHALRNGRSFMANEYGITMTCVPDWDSVRASKTVAAVLLGELSIGTPREAGTRAAAEYLDCPLVTIPGAHNGLRDRPVTAANAVRDVLER